eukprot:533693-Pyramimonas_sp.AAC.1
MASRAARYCLSLVKVACTMPLRGPRQVAAMCACAACLCAHPGTATMCICRMAIPNVSTS